MAHVNIAKFEDYLPLYRQERILQRIGVDIPRATLSNWVIKSSLLLRPLYNLLRDHIQAYDIASADETRVQVLKEPGRDSSQQSTMWVFGGGLPNKRAFIYHYSPTRSHSVVEEVLGDFCGYLHCDGYPGYDTYAKKRDHLIQVGCWYHVRRYFKEAEKLSPLKGLASEAIHMIKALSKIEKQGKNLKPEGRRLLRLKKSKPLLKQFRQWLEKNNPTVLPQSALGKAFTYAINQWSKLMIYLNDGRLEFSNNHMERAVKPFVIGRKNWLFANSVLGAQAAAIIYSLIETCKANKIATYDYLVYAFSKLPLCETLEDYEALLPFNVEKKLLA